VQLNATARARQVKSLRNLPLCGVGSARCPLIHHLRRKGGVARHYRQDNRRPFPCRTASRYSGPGRMSVPSKPAVTSLRCSMRM
jgi:hypothetical protein